MNNIIIAAGIVFLQASTIDAQILIAETEITAPHFPSKEVVVQGEAATSIQDYLVKSLASSPEDFRSRHAGTEVIRFRITEEGQLSDFEVINSISPEIDEMMIRILKTSEGYWLPGTIDGEPASMTREVSMAFKPSPGYDLVGKARNYQDKANSILFEKDDPKRALRYYRRACTLLPYEECVLVGICLCSYKLGDSSGFLKALDRLKSIHPQSPEDRGSDLPMELFAYLNKLQCEH